jgi:hypothetical protein
MPTSVPAPQKQSRGDRTGRVHDRTETLALTTRPPFNMSKARSGPSMSLSQFRVGDRRGMSDWGLGRINAKRGKRGYAAAVAGQKYTLARV